MKDKLTQTIINCLISDLSNFLHEEYLDEEHKLGYFSDFLLSSNVDSKIIVEVLEKFGNEGMEAARNIKVSEGW